VKEKRALVKRVLNRGIEGIGGNSVIKKYGKWSGNLGK